MSSFNQLRFVNTLARRLGLDLAIGLYDTYLAMLLYHVRTFN